MGKKLAIKGHETRGKEVIELLKMMGGHNGSSLFGDNSNCAYFITDSRNIGCKDINYILISYFTLEEFLKKYPFKVGDAIRFPNQMLEEIAEMRWNEELEDIIYTSVSGWTRPCQVPKNTTNEINVKTDCPNKTTKDMEENKIDLTLKGELYHGNRISYQIPDGYEVSKIENGEIILQKKKPKYPTTYEECCKIMQVARPTIWFDYDDVSSISKEGDEYESRLENTLCTFRKLLICRNAYWKIAGEEMGLDKPWEPDFNSGQFIPAIIYRGGFIQKVEVQYKNTILAFPTTEMREAFFENFKKEIEECKELL